MTSIQNFRSARNGFHRQDVVNYIEYMNHKHNLQVEQLNSQLQAALAKSGDSELQARLEAAEARIRELEAAQGGQPAEPVSCTEQELEAYRRAERTERQAKERAQQICQQANAVLADATVKAEEISGKIGAMADEVAEQLKQYQQAVLDTKQAYQEATDSLYAIRPETEESI